MLASGIVLLNHGRRVVGQSGAQELGDTVLESYMHGLRHAGFQADPQQVRLGCSAYGAMNRLLGFGIRVPALLDHSIYCLWEMRFGLPIEEIADRFAAMQRRRTYDWVEEARQLLEEL